LLDSLLQESIFLCSRKSDLSRLSVTVILTTSVLLCLILSVCLEVLEATMTAGQSVSPVCSLPV